MTRTLSAISLFGATCLAMACGSSSGSDPDATQAIDAAAPLVDAEPVPLAEWILTLDNSEDNLVHQLVRISIAEETFGAVTTICPDVTLPESVPPDNIISSLTFNDGKLYASGRGTDEGDTLFLVDPCDCTATAVGQYGYTFVAGITSNGAQDMFGISGEQDVIFNIAPETAMGQMLKALETDWNTVGLTWSGDVRDSLWGISGATDELVEFDPSNGDQLGATVMDFNFTSVGVEYHPGVDVIYACSGTGELLTVNPMTGAVTVGPDLGLGSCNNLAAPFGSVSCIE